MNSVGSQFTPAVKVWLRETTPLSFTHRALLRSVTQCSHWKTDRRGAVPFFLLFFLVKKTGGAFRIQSVTDRGPNVVNGYKLFIKVWKIRPAVPVLHNEATEPLCIPHARFPKAVRYYILKLFFPPFFSICPILHRPPKVHCWDQTFPHRECSCPSFAMPSSRPTSSSLHTLCRVLQVSQVSRSSPVCSVFVLCHSVHIHFSPTLYAGLFQPSLATSVRGVRRYTVCT